MEIAAYVFKLFSEFTILERPFIYILSTFWFASEVSLRMCEGSLHARIQRVDRGFGPPEKSQNIGFLSNTGPDRLINHKATKLAFKDGPSSACQLNAIQMAFRWLANDGQLLVGFGSSPPPQKKKKNRKQIKNKIKKQKRKTKRCQSWTPSGKTFWIRACAGAFVVQQRDSTNISFSGEVI